MCRIFEPDEFYSMDEAELESVCRGAFPRSADHRPPPSVAAADRSRLRTCQHQVRLLRPGHHRAGLSQVGPGQVSFSFINKSINFILEANDISLVSELICPF